VAPIFVDLSINQNLTTGIAADPYAMRVLTDAVIYCPYRQTPVLINPLIEA